MQVQPHSLTIIPITASRLLERFGFYGMRSLLMIYLVSYLQMAMPDAGKTYGYFLGLMAIIPVFGGLLGDLLLGSRLAIVIGGFIQALGCFVLCIPNTIGVYAGLVLIAIGVGISNPNYISLIGIIYKSKRYALDSALLIFYTGINIGACLAPLILGTIGERTSFQIGFLISGICICISQIIILVSGKLFQEFPMKANMSLTETETKTPVKGIHIAVIISIFIFIPIFWMLYTGTQMAASMKLQSTADLINIGFLRNWPQVTGIFISVLLGIVLSIVWFFVKVSPIIKISIGFFILVLGNVLLAGFFESQGGISLIVILCVVFILQGISELFIAPIAMGVISRYVSVRWMSTIMGAYLTISALISSANFIIYNLSDKFGQQLTLLVSSALLFICGIIFFIFYIFSKSAN